jgi:carbon starvation protein
MRALTPLIVIAIVFALAYRYYSAFLAAKVLALDPERATPAMRRNDNQSFVPMNRWLLLGHHFAAISGAGPLIGPVLAAQFGYLPGLLWILVGAVVAGAVHDMIVLFASVRHEGQSILTIAKDELGPASNWLFSILVLFLLIITMAGASIAVVNALFDSPWGVFTVAVTVPISIFIGAYLRWFRPGHVAEASLIGVTLIVAGVWGGSLVGPTTLGRMLTLSREQLSIALPIYSFFAASLPVWLLLVPRDYLSSYIKVGTIILMVGGMVASLPLLRLPAVTQYASGGGPIISGKVVPFLFITIACGAFSGYHCIVCSGTTPKMVRRESDVRLIGYGSMLVEGIVAVMALLAVSVLHPGDFLAISTRPEVFATLGTTVRDLPELSRLSGETLAGRPGGAATLAAGMANLLGDLGGRERMLSFWYHFAIAFQALFILTLIDAGTRAGRYLLQEVSGRIYRPLNRTTWLPGVILSTACICAAWGHLLYGGSISVIWPLFGVNNQLLGCIALAIGTSLLIRMGKVRYVWTTLLPLAFLAVVSVWAGVINVVEQYIPERRWLLATTATISLCISIWILGVFVAKWIHWLREQRGPS